MERRTVSWFSAGAASAVATKLLLRDMERMRQTIYSTFCIPSDVLAQLAMPESNSGKNKQLTAGLIK